MKKSPQPLTLKTFLTSHTKQALIWQYLAVLAAPLISVALTTITFGLSIGSTVELIGTIVAWGLCGNFIRSAWLAQRDWLANKIPSSGLRLIIRLALLLATIIFTIASMVLFSLFVVFGLAGAAGR